MKEIIVWIVHAPAGTIGLVAAAVALCATKGARLHRKAGTCFTVAMLVMLVSGFIAAALKESIDEMFLSAVVIYTVFTAWLTAHHKNNDRGLLEHVALVWIAAVAIAAFYLNFNWRDAGVPNPYPYWAGFAVLCAIGDVRNLLGAGLPGTQRVIRHVWRIGFSLIWAALSLADKLVKIAGSNVKDLPTDQLLYVIAVPILLILLPILYWILNVSILSRQKFSGYGD